MSKLSYWLRVGLATGPAEVNVVTNYGWPCLHAGRARVLLANCSYRLCGQDLANVVTMKPVLDAAGYTSTQCLWSESQATP